MSKKIPDNQIEIGAGGDNLNQAIRYACEQRVGLIDMKFMCQSVSVLQSKVPVFVRETDTLAHVLKRLREHRVGCVLVVDAAEQLKGIFSERDFLLKVADQFEQVKEQSIENFMTKDPITQGPDDTIAYALNLMSQGGFRHLPVLSPTGKPIGLISVKDVVDFLVNSFTQDVLSFETSN